MTNGCADNDCEDEVGLIDVIKKSAGDGRVAHIVRHEDEHKEE